MTIDLGNIPKDLYGRIKQVMPIVCVDLVVIDRENRILLIKRNNEPAKNQWWFPGGRVHYGELRIEAAKRKLFQECGLSGESFQELGTFDCLLHSSEGLSHAVATCYQVNIQDNKVSLDHQSSDFAWKTFQQWIAELRDQAIREYLEKCVLHQAE